MKGVQYMCDTGGRFFRTSFHSPILRIGLLLGVVVAATGCDKLGLGDNGSPTAPSPPAPGSAIFYTAVGASDAAGVGSSAECVPFTDCPNGMGYVPVTVRALKAQGFTVTSLNGGIPTTVIGPDFGALGAMYGRIIVGSMIETQMPFVQTNATVVTIFAGVNEILTIRAALGGGAGGSDPNAFIDAQVRAFANDYATLLTGIRARAGSPRIVILNVPNAAGMPFMAAASLADRQAAQRMAVGMSKTVVNPLVSSSVTVIDMMCDGRSYAPSNYSSDGLHPNDPGYAFISSEVVKAITQRSYPAPQASCAGMTIVP
ncbi:MAG TPA: SGNH/GDSL hydrolase family protein [Vicinamibacterales bacterium]|nr:SGNH/GDSL hydrolase family protein [Vicinamibacterales bacterium]